MFSPEDFELPIEKALRMRVIRDELEKCEDIQEVRKQIGT